VIGLFDYLAVFVVIGQNNILVYFYCGELKANTVLLLLNFHSGAKVPTCGLF